MDAIHHYNIYDPCKKLHARDSYPVQVHSCQENPESRPRSKAKDCGVQLCRRLNSSPGNTGHLCKARKQTCELVFGLGMPEESILLIRSTKDVTVLYVHNKHRSLSLEGPPFVIMLYSAFLSNANLPFHCWSLHNLGLASPAAKCYFERMKAEFSEP